MIVHGIICISGGFVTAAAGDGRSKVSVLRVSRGTLFWFREYKPAHIRNQALSTGLHDTMSYYFRLRFRTQGIVMGVANAWTEAVYGVRANSSDVQPQSGCGIATSARKTSLTGTIADSLSIACR